MAANFAFHGQFETPMQNPLDAYREAHEMTYEQLADKVGCSKSQAHAWATGKALPRDEQADKIEAATGVTYLALRKWRRENAQAA